ncbi:hypothetical protein BH10CHL1_BH10CHL1_11570 [soil metagenome]
MTSLNLIVTPRVTAALSAVQRLSATERLS